MVHATARYFALAVAALAGAAAAAPSSSGGNSEADWVKKPRSEDLATVWPRDAIRKGLDGEVMLRCVVTVEGLLSRCEVKSETPPGLGYGAAALQLTPQFQMKPKKVNGAPVEGIVLVPVNFRGAASIQLAPMTEFVVNPLWTKAPTKADVLAAYPNRAKGESGKVLLECWFGKAGALVNCHTLSEEPRYKGFTEAAQSLSHKFKGATLRENGKSSEGVKVRVSFYFGPGGVTPSVNPDILARSIAWVSAADPDAANALYPAQAKAAHVQNGHVTLKCAIQPQGKLGDCMVERETPTGLGFGEAAAKIGAMFTANPWSSDGRPIDGDEIRLPLILEDPDAPPAPAGGAAPATPKP